MKILLTALGLLACSGATFAQPDRFPPLKLEDTQGDQRASAERMLKETRIGLGGPWNVMLRSPNMSEGLLNLYNYFRWKTALPQPLVELAILATAREPLYIPAEISFGAVQSRQAAERVGMNRVPRRFFPRDARRRDLRPNGGGHVIGEAGPAPDSGARTVGQVVASDRVSRACPSPSSTSCLSR